MIKTKSFLMINNLAITFACLNQSDYTRKCLDSLLFNDEIKPQQITVVDNASNDDTSNVVGSYSGVTLISNRTNLGCGVAWNQGILEHQAEWTIVMNNDVVVVPSWAEGLVRAAKKSNLQLICPAMIEGSDDYNIYESGLAKARQAKDHLRIGHVHAVCMLVHESVWKSVGFFRASPSLLGYEDTLFFNECRRNGIRMATVGSSWIHHYGSITQNAMRRERGLSERDGLGNRYNYRLLGKSWVTRKLEKYISRQALRKYQTEELSRYGFTLHGQKRAGEQVNWKVY